MHARPLSVEEGPQPDPEKSETGGKLTDSRGYVPFVIVAAIVLAADQWSKAFVTSYLDSHGVGQVALLGGKVYIDRVHNSGAAFGILPNQTVLFIVIAVAIVTALVISYHRLAHGPLLLRIGLGLVLGGALGNLVDRIRLGYVTDFIDLRWWPVFNVADSCIVVGVMILILTLMVQAERRVEAH